LESGLVVIPLLILVSGAVAYIGNLVGRATGRRRLTIFGLRPRSTAQIITILTGMLITIITVASVLVVSQDARTGLFRLNELRDQIETAEARLREVKGGDISYLRNQEVFRTVLDGRLPPDEILRHLDEMRLRAVDFAVGNGVAPDLATGAVLSLYPPNASWEAIARLIAGRGGDTVVRIVALENTLRGESLRVFVQLVDRKVAYKKGAILATGTIDGRRSREQIGLDLLGLADKAADTAGVSARLLSPPFARITDPPQVQVDIDDHRRVIGEIQARGRLVDLQVVAGRDITTENSLIVSFLIQR
jgi:hypothetical protein